MSTLSSPPSPTLHVEIPRYHNPLNPSSPIHPPHPPQPPSPALLGTAKAEKEMTPLKAFLSGGGGGVCYVLCNHPFDTLKVRFQTGTHSTLLRTLQHSLSKQGAGGGWKSLYKGLTSPLIGVTPMWAFSFWAYDISQRLVSSSYLLSTPIPHFTLPHYLLSGALSALPTALITVPIERLKILMQTSSPKTQTLSHTITHIWKSSGPKGFYRGTLATLLRDIPGFAGYYSTYELLSRTPPVSTNTASSSSSDADSSNGLDVKRVLFAGGMAGVVQWTVSIPFDVVKSHMQSTPPPPPPSPALQGTVLTQQQLNLRETVVKIWKSQGPRGFFKGLGPAVALSFPTNAVALLGRVGALEVLHGMF
ncbi:carnitine transporter [Chytridiales sp. JEL 0842]|nr:carnitine transporter [Chytridiales sp. JEL 0842]